VAGSGRVLDSYADQDQSYGGVFGGDGGGINQQLETEKAKRPFGLFAFYGCPTYPAFKIFPIIASSI
jgi:hypothetical protein